MLVLISCRHIAMFLLQTIEYKLCNYLQLLLNRAILRYRRKASCHRYHGNVCKGYLEPSRFYYFTVTSPSTYDRSLVNSFQTANTMLSSKCKRFVLHLLCVAYFVVNRQNFDIVLAVFSRVMQNIIYNYLTLLHPDLFLVNC